MSDSDNPRNDKINKAVRDIGYCCPYSFFMQNSSKRDTNKRLAKKVNMSEVAMRFNRRKLRNGEMKCQGCDDCQIKEAPAET